MDVKAFQRMPGVEPGGCLGAGRFWLHALGFMVAEFVGVCLGGVCARTPHAGREPKAPLVGRRGEGVNMCAKVVMCA